MVRLEGRLAFFHTTSMTGHRFKSYPARHFIIFSFPSPLQPLENGPFWDAHPGYETGPEIFRVKGKCLLLTCARVG